MLQQDISFGMQYKIPISDRILHENLNHNNYDNENLTIKIGISIDIQDLVKAIDFCLTNPTKDISWSNLDELFQVGLDKYLTKEQSLKIIDIFLQYFQTQQLISLSSINVIQACLKKYCIFVPPDIIDFLFKYFLSNINCHSKISVIERSLHIISIILPLANEDQRLFFIQYIRSVYPQISFMDSFPHSTFLICINNFFEICSFAETYTTFQQLSRIILSFLPHKQWGLPFDSIDIVYTAVSKDPNICLILLQPNFKFLPILTELVSRNLESLSLNSINLFMAIIKSLQIIPESLQKEHNVDLFLNLNKSSMIISKFVNTAMRCLPTPFEKFEICIVNCVTQSLQIGIDPNLLNILNIFSLVGKIKYMSFKQKKAIISFASVVFQKVPFLFIKPFSEIDNGAMINLVFESISDADEELLADGLSILLVLINMRKLLIKNLNPKNDSEENKFINYFIKVFDPNSVELEPLTIIDNEDIQNLIFLIEKEINIK